MVLDWVLQPHAKAMSQPDSIGVYRMVIVKPSSGQANSFVFWGSRLRAVVIILTENVNSSIKKTLLGGFCMHANPCPIVSP